MFFVNGSSLIWKMYSIISRRLPSVLNFWQVHDQYVVTVIERKGKKLRSGMIVFVIYGIIALMHVPNPNKRLFFCHFLEHRKCS